MTVEFESSFELLTQEEGNLYQIVLASTSRLAS